jgi:hypothetical protein
MCFVCEMDMNVRGPEEEYVNVRVSPKFIWKLNP